MMKPLISTFLIALISLSVFAQNKAEDKKAIKAMCGCYAVSFDYAETFAADTSYKLHDQYHASAPAEWIFVEEETDERLVLQHLLVINDTVIIKHWRQDWVYENQDFYQFYVDRRWNYEGLAPKQVKGQWTQKVYQVDDSPRYEGTATWVHVDGKHYWVNTSDAPLPRREFSKRSDYNVMQRTNKHVLTDEGWLHEQDNLKVIRIKGQPDSVIVAEKGLNNYVRVDEAKCEAGRKWWEENSTYWKLVRMEWDKKFANKQDLQLIKKVDDKLLWQALFELGDEMREEASTSPAKVSKEIGALISAYLTDADQANADY